MGCLSVVFYVIGTSSYDIKNAPLRIALRRSGRILLKRPAAGGESCLQDSFSFKDFLIFFVQLCVDFLA